MPLADRRRPRVTIDELRRQLRDADEDRFNLARQAVGRMLGGANPFDRRHPRVSIQDVRRDLREADEDRFRLSMTSRRQSRSPGKPRVLGLLLLLAGTGLVVKSVQAPRGPTAAVTRPMLASDVSATPQALGSAVALQAASKAEPSVAPRAPRPMMAQRTSPSGSTARRNPRQQTTAVPRETPKPVRAVPRPLHPGEFGRRPPVN